MSTGQYQGYAVDKPTSKVMAPPGGRSSNIFGTYEEEKKPVAANGAATTTTTAAAGLTSNGSNGTSSNGTNGTNGTNNGISPSAQNNLDAAAIKKQQVAGNNLFGANDNASNANANRKKRTGYNPITGESYDDEPTPAAPSSTNGTPTAPAPASNTTTPQAQPPQNNDAQPTEGKPLHTSISVKQPPGGRSTKLW